MAQVKISELTKATVVNNSTIVLIVNNGETQTTSLETVKNVLLEDVNIQLGDMQSVLNSLVTVKESE